MVQESNMDNSNITEEDFIRGYWLSRYCNGIMGVPIIFLDKYNSGQFEIIDALNKYAIFDFFQVNQYVKDKHSHCCNINGTPIYYRIVIRKKLEK